MKASQRQDIRGEEKQKKFILICKKEKKKKLRSGSTE